MLNLLTTSPQVAKTSMSFTLRPTSKMPFSRVSARPSNTKVRQRITPTQHLLTTL